MNALPAFVALLVVLPLRVHETGPITHAMWTAGRRRGTATTLKPSWRSSLQTWRSTNPKIRNHSIWLGRARSSA